MLYCSYYTILTKDDGCKSLISMMLKQNVIDLLWAIAWWRLIHELFGLFLVSLMLFYSLKMSKIQYDISEKMKTQSRKNLNV